MKVSDLESISRHQTMIGSTTPKQNHRHEGSGRIIRSILSNKDLHQSQSSRISSEQQIQTSHLEKEKQPRRPFPVQILKGTNGTPENRIGVHDLHVSSERQERRVRHKDRPDRVVWTNRSNGGDDSLSSSASSQVDPLEGTCFIHYMFFCFGRLVLCAFVNGDRLEKLVSLIIQTC